MITKTKTVTKTITTNYYEIEDIKKFLSEKRHYMCIYLYKRLSEEDYKKYFPKPITLQTLKRKIPKIYDKVSKENLKIQQEKEQKEREERRKQAEKEQKEIEQEEKEQEEIKYNWFKEYIYKNNIYYGCYKVFDINQAKYIYLKVSFTYGEPYIKCTILR